MFILWSEEEKEVKGKGKSKGKRWRRKKAQLAELTVTKPSCLQTGIPACMCLCACLFTWLSKLLIAPQA